MGGLEASSADDRTMAMRAHRLMAFTGFIGPVVILAVKQDSCFVKFHSLQAVIWLGFLGVWAVNLILGVVYTINANRGERAAYPVFGEVAAAGERMTIKGRTTRLETR